MFKRLGQRRETKKQKTKEQKSKQLWGRDFNIVENGLDEEQVVSFVDELMKQPKASPSASVRSVLKTAVADAEQIIASIKMKAQTEAEEEAAGIIAKANEEAEAMKSEAKIAAEKEATDALSMANRKSEITEVEAEQEALLRAKEKAEEVEVEKAEVEKAEVEKAEAEKAEVEKAEVEKVEAEEVEEPVQLRNEAAVSEPVAAATEEFLEQHFPEERPDGKETELDLLKGDRHPLYTGEVELAISMPVDPKMVSKLYNYLQITPEIKLVHTSGSWDRGTTITIVLDKPIPLIDVLSSKIPEAKVTPERPEKDGFVKGKRGVRRIKLAL